MDDQVQLDGRVVAVDAAAVRAHRDARYRLHATADDEILYAARDAHRGEVDGLEARAAEAVQRHAGHHRRPARGERRLASDAGALLTGLLHAARDDVPDVVQVDAGPLQPVGRLREQLLRVNGRDLAVLLLPRSVRTASMM